MKRQKYIFISGLICFVLMVHLLTSLTGTTYYLTQLTMSAYYAMVVIGLAAFMGYAGQISIGHAGFFAIGGYVSAGLTTHNLLAYKDSAFIALLDSFHLLEAGENLYGEQLLTVTPWAACVCGVLLAVCIALLIGVPVLKLKGHYLAMATLGFGIIIFQIVVASEYFGEADGLSGVPPFVLFPGVNGVGTLTLSGDFAGRVQNYYIAWIMLVVGLLLLLNLIDSRIGRGLRAIHGSEEAAQAIGVHTSRLKLQIFVMSAVYASLAGVFLTHYNGSIGPSEASVMKSVRYVALVAVGGMANIRGTLIMGVLLTFLSLRGVFGSYDDAVFGSILILVMLFTPDGILSINLRGFMQRLKPETEKG